jgi:hypothetical protein
MNRNTYSLSYDKNHSTVQQTISTCCESLIDIIENNYISQEDMLIYIMGLYNKPLNIEKVK